MTTTQAGAVGSGEVCRLVIYGPSSRVELAVPAYVPLTDLLPTFVTHLGGELPTTGLAHGGWVLQRLGEPPLEEDLGTAALGLYDGDVLYLRPRADQLPPVDFDDLVDGVATATVQRPDRWVAEHTRRALLALLGLALATGLALVPALGSGGRAALVAGAAATVLLLGAGAVARAAGDTTVGTVLAAGGLGYAGLAGLALPAGVRPVPAGAALLTAPGLLGAGAAVAAAAVLAAWLVGAGTPAWAAVSSAGALLAAGGALVTLPGIGPAGAAAVVLTVTLALGVAVPVVAARIAGLRIAPLPTSAAEFQLDIDPEPSREVQRRASRADTYVGTLYLGAAAVCAGCLLVLGRDRGWAGPALAGTAAFLLLLHTRELRGTRHRLATLAPGVVGAVAVLWSVTATPERRPLALAGLAVLVAALAGLTRVLPGRRLLPHWGRLADLLHTAAAIAVVPLALAVLDLYALVRRGGA